MEVVNAHNEGRESGKIDIVSTLDGGGSLDVGRDATAAAIQTDSDLSAIFAINDPSALGAHRALEQAGKAGDVTIIAFDGQIDGKRAIRDGKIYADPIQFPDQMGQLTVQRIVAYLNGEDFEEITLIPTVLYRKADADKDPELREANE
jgi:ribose transport system substrate-binding protein